MNERDCLDEINRRLKASGQRIFTRGWQQDPPNFKGVRAASERLLAAFPDARTYLVMRYAVLRVLRELILERDLGLVVPCKCGSDVFRIPRGALFDLNGVRTHESLAIHPPPAGSTICSGPVDVVVTGCLGFNPNERRLYALDDERGAYLVDEWREGLPNGFRLTPDTPVVAVAADEQQVQGWPACARSFLRAEQVFTPGRTVRLGRSDPKGERIQS